MDTSVIVALVTGGFTLLGTAITVIMTSKKTDETFRIAQTKMETQLAELTREVREHNNFARRVPVVEQQIEDIKRRLDDIERGNR